VQGDLPSAKRKLRYIYPLMIDLTSAGFLSSGFARSTFVRKSGLRLIARKSNRAGTFCFLVTLKKHEQRSMSHAKDGTEGAD